MWCGVISGLCFLNHVGIAFIDNYPISFYVLKHAGKSGQTTREEWNPQMYYETNILDCNQKLMAIPISLIVTYGNN